MADTPRPMGALGSSFGVKGWMKVRSFASQPENLFDYSPWFIRQRGAEWCEVQVEEYRPHGNDFVVKLNVASTPEEAKAYAGAEIGIRRSSLPPVPEGTYYLCDIEGCTVIGLEGVMLGKVSRIRDYGATPILECLPLTTWLRNVQKIFLFLMSWAQLLKQLISKLRQLRLSGA